MDDSAVFCHRCSRRTVSDGVVRVTAAGKVTHREVVMLYDLERARQLLSGATLTDQQECRLSLEPPDQSGKTYAM